MDRVEETGEPYSMKPMNPFERKVVHDVVAAAGLVSDSSGVGQDRHVVITLPDDDYDDDYSGDSAESAESADSGESAESAESADE